MVHGETNKKQHRPVKKVVQVEEEEEEDTAGAAGDL